MNRFVSNIRSLYLSIYDTWHLPKRFLNQVVERNLRSLLFITPVVFMFGFIMLLEIKNNPPFSVSLYNFYLNYYSLISILSFLFFVLSLVMLKLRKLPSFVRSIPIFISLISYLLLSISVHVFARNLIYSMLTLSIIILISTLYFDENPIFYLLTAFPAIIFLGHRAYNVYGNFGFAIFLIYAIISVMASFFKRRITVRNYKQKESLAKNSWKLSDEVDKKTKLLKDKNEKLNKLQDDIIIGLANIVENRDTETGDHIQRTSSYVEFLAKKAREKRCYVETLNSGYIGLIRKVAPLHDIGKIVVPDSILKKPGKLTPEEFDIMKTHASEGGKLIKSVLGSNADESYVKMATEVATYHHEKWDGSGYPYGKKGEEIPLSARIMAIADVFDALVSVRCYKAPMPFEQAIGIIKEGAGKHFDPVLADIFVAEKDAVKVIMEEKYEN